VVAAFRHAFEAHLARAALEEDGIQASLAGEHTAAVLVGVQSVELRVAAADARRARALLAARLAPPRASGSADWITADLDAPRCGQCGSLRLVPVRVLFPGVRRRARCERCGETWREG
jgi:hypothetical protein